MEGEAVLAPIELAMGDDAPCLAFEVRDHVLVAHFEHAALGEHSTPMRHELGIFAIMSAELGKVVSVVLLGGEEPRETGEAGVQRVSHHMDDAGIRKREMDEADEAVIRRHFVRDA